MRLEAPSAMHGARLWTDGFPSLWLVCPLAPGVFTWPGTLPLESMLTSSWSPFLNSRRRHGGGSPLRAPSEQSPLFPSKCERLCKSKTLGRHGKRPERVLGSVLELSRSRALRDLPGG